jgi:FKBP-type peptidyl-prolyl cis-trans isomerase FkpA
MIALALGLLLLVATACGSAPAAPASHPTAVVDAPSVDASTAIAKPVTTTTTPAAEITREDVVIGTGDTAGSGDHITVHYEGTLLNGTVFDSSRKHGRPFDFILGRRQVIDGWDQGVAGMKVGGRRKLTIPPELAYGERGQPPDIPPNSTLKFDIELLAIEHPSSSAGSHVGTITARHILVEYMGSRNAEPSIVRTREQARAVAQEVAGRAKAGEDFSRLAVEYSDEPGAGPRGGALGQFGRGKFVPEFDAAAFALKPGEISSVVETPFGFHVIQRLE